MTTLNTLERDKFDALAREWWQDKGGAHQLLHRMNPIRLGYVYEQLQAFSLTTHLYDIKALTFLDVGCGGGVFCEPLARKGAHVTGIDASALSIEVARQHALEHNLSVIYEAMEVQHCTGVFDIVTAFEVLEHVDEPAIFVRDLLQKVKPGGLLIMSTLNRTWPAYLGAIVAAEYILKWVPCQTHEWKQFIKPSELSQWAKAAGGNLQHLQGMRLNPITQEWSLTDRININYLATIQRAY